MSLEINGFYRDPATGRYFRKVPDTAGPSTFIHGLISKPKEPLAQYFPKVKNIPELLQNREYGCRNNSSIDLPFLSLKLNSLQISEPEPAIGYNDWVENVMYLKGGQDSIFALWESSGGVPSSNWLVIGEVCHYLTKDQPFDLGAIQAYSGVADFCDGFSQSKCFMSVSNDLATGHGRVQVIWRQPENEHIEEWARSHSRKSTVWCCCCNSFTERFAVGCERAVGIDSASRNLFNRHVNGNVHAVQFNNIGNIIYCGVNTGRINIVDLRATGNIMKKLYDVGVDEVVLLFDQMTLICGTFDGKLCKFDLRMMKKVTEYFGHVHTPRKVPFSLSETFNLLCATGSDNVTRLWSLDGGYPVKIIKPPHANSPHRSWLISDDSSAKVYIIQRDQKYHFDISDL